MAAMTQVDRACRDNVVRLVRASTVPSDPDYLEVLHKAAHQYWLTADGTERDFREKTAKAARVLAGCIEHPETSKKSADALVKEIRKFERLAFEWKAIKLGYRRYLDRVKAAKDSEELAEALRSEAERAIIYI